MKESETYQSPPSSDRLLRLQDVTGMVGLSRSTVYEMVSANEFPRPVKIGRSSLWRLSAIQKWIAALDQKGAKEMEVSA